MKLLKLLLIIVCLASLVIGCSSRSSNDISDDGDQQLTILIGASNDPLSNEIVKIFREVVIQFETNHPGVKVTLDTLTQYDQYDDKILNPETGDEVPNIIVVQPNKFTKYVEHGALTDLTLYANMDNIPMSDFYQPLLENASNEGRWLTVPFAPDPFVVYYNKEWFEQANLPYPESDWTWEDFANTAKLLKDSRPFELTNQYGGILSANLFLIEPLIISRGGSILSPDGKRASGYLDSDESVQAVQFLIDFYKQQRLDEDSYSPVDTGNKAGYFINGNAGMILADANSLYYLEPELKGKLGVASLPSFQSGVRVNPFTTLGISIVEQSDDKQLAWELLKLMTIERNEFTQQWSQWFLTNNVPLAIGTGQDTDPFKNVLLEELNYIHPTALSMNEYYVNVFNMSTSMELPNMLNELITKEGAEDIKSQLSSIAQYIDKEMALSEAAASKETE